MTDTCVLDASAALSALVPGQATEAARGFFVHGRTAWRAPALLRLEVRNALVRLERRGLVERGAADASLALLEVEIDFADAPDAVALARTLDVARGLGLSVYDASYLDLARTNGAALATRDGALLAAAQGAGVAVRDLR